MNLYFWGFMLYALWIVPVSVQVSIRKEATWEWRVQIRVGSIRLASFPKQRTAKVQKGRVDGKDRAEIVRNVLQSDIIRLLRHAVHLEAIVIRLHLSMKDAAGTVLVYSTFRTVIQTLMACRALPDGVGGRITMDFQADGSRMALHCIFASRVGILSTAAARAALAVKRKQARLAAKEDQHAASH